MVTIVVILSHVIIFVILIVLSSQKDEKDYTRIGCYTEDDLKNKGFSYKGGLGSCYNRCFRNKFFAAIEASNPKCFCGEAIPENQTEEENCVPCYKEWKCGKKEDQTHFVYSHEKPKSNSQANEMPDVLPWYRYFKCYKNDWKIFKDPSNYFNNEGIKVTECVKNCDGKNYMGMAVKYCVCSDEMILPIGREEPENECQLCPNRNSETDKDFWMCGKENSIFIYRRIGFENNQVVPQLTFEDSGLEFKGCYLYEKDNKRMKKGPHLEYLMPSECVSKCRGRKFFGFLALICACFDEFLDGTKSASDPNSCSNCTHVDEHSRDYMCGKFGETVAIYQVPGKIK